MVGDSNDETNFPHKLLLTNTQVLRLRKAFENNSLANTKFLKTQLPKIGQSGRFLGRLLGSLLKTGLPLLKNILKPLAKSVFIALASTAAASRTISAIQKKIFGSGMTTLITSNEEMINTMKKINFIEDTGFLIKCVSETIKNEAKEQRGGFLIMLLGTLGVSLLGSLLTGNGTKRSKIPRQKIIRAGEGMIRAEKNFNATSPLSNFERQEYQNEPKFKGVY